MTTHLMMFEEAGQLPPWALLRVRFWQEYEGEDTEVLQIDGVLYVPYDALPHHIVQAQLEEFMLFADQMICDELTTFERLA